MVILFNLIFINLSIFYINSEIKELLMSRPKNKKQVKNIIFLVISLSSVLAKNKEITGDMLNKAHPTPMGRVFKHNLL